METHLRCNNIHAIRLALALLVVLSHCYPLGTGSDIHEPLVVATGGQLTLGGLAVDGFFILSGFLIAQSWEHLNSLGPFLLRRASRIYPGFIVAVAICSWIIVPCLGGSGAQTFSTAHLTDFLASTPRLLAPEYREVFVENAYPKAVNGSVWSIPYEFWCYIGVAAMGLLGLLRRRAVVAVIFVGAIFVHWLFQVLKISVAGGILGVVFGYPPFWARLLPVYLAGVVFYLYREKLHPNGKLTFAALIGLTICARVPHGLVWAIPTLGTYVLFYLAFTQRVRLHGFGRFGDFSYGAYLYAFPIQQSIVALSGGRMEPGLLLLYALPASLLAGVVSWYAVERYFLVRSATAKRPEERGATVDHCLGGRELCARSAAVNDP